MQRLYRQHLRVLRVLALTALLTPPVLVSAHADMVSSTPASGSTLSDAPARVTAIFDQELESSGTTMTVTDAGGRRADAGDASLDLNDLDHKTLVVSLKSGLGAGTYTVRWTAVSAEDGDSHEGSFSFMVKAPVGEAGPTAPPVSPKELPTTGSGAQPSWWLMLAAVLLCLMGLICLRHNAKA